MKCHKVLQVLISLLMFVLAHSELLAVSAYPYKVLVETTDGKTVEIFMRGDEHQRYAVTTDGYTLLSDSQGWWYATASEDGYAVKSNFKLTAPTNESEALKTFKSTCLKGIVPKREESQLVTISDDTRRVSTTNSMTGERHALVILMQFRDLPFSKSREEFASLFNTVGYHENGVSGSVRDYYKWASQGQLDYISDIYGPYTAHSEMKYYGSNENHVVDLCIEAIQNLPNDIDYTHYDNDKDGVVDNIHIIFAGYGEEAGASSDAIWSHEYPHRISLKREVGYAFAGYSCTPELRGNRGGQTSHIGVICHELGHALGAMDYYDTNYKTGGEYVGTGKWDIMANGSWNDEGRTPSNFNPYVRTAIFKWNYQVTLVGGQQVTMPPREVDNAQETVVYRLETGNKGDYFLLENRQKRAFDTAIPGEGLMIYHVHPSLETYRSTNTINATHPQCFYPVCASGSHPRNKQYGNINSASCPFPGTSRATAFTGTTNPAAIAWNGATANVSITDIKMNALDGTITFSTSGSFVEPEESDEPRETELRYRESFETIASSEMNVESVFGKNLWRTYQVGNWVVDAERIPKPTNGNKILMIYTGKDSSLSESEFVSHYIEVEPLEDYVLSFDVYTDNIGGVFVPSLNVYVEDNRESKIYSLEEATGEWRHVNLSLRFGEGQFRYKFNGTVASGGIFIDNICLSQKMGTGLTSQQKTDGLRIEEDKGSLFVFSKEHRKLKLYSLAGRLVYQTVIERDMPVVLNSILHGAYLMDVGNGKIIKIFVK